MRGQERQGIGMDPNTLLVIEPHEGSGVVVIPVRREARPALSNPMRGQEDVPLLAAQTAATRYRTP